MTSRARTVPSLVSLLLMLMSGAAAHAEFHVWVDGAGRRHISNVTPSGPRGDGAGLAFGHPNAIAAQHRRLRETLARRDAELARRAARRGENYNREMKANRDVPR